MAEAETPMVCNHCGGPHPDHADGHELCGAICVVESGGHFEGASYVDVFAMFAEELVEKLADEGDDLDKVSAAAAKMLRWLVYPAPTPALAQTALIASLDAYIAEVECHEDAHSQ